MPCSTPIEINLNDLFPDLELGVWNDQSEEQCLASFDSDNLSAGVETLLKHFAEKTFSGVSDKLEALNRICDSARTNQGNRDSEALFDLLTSEAQDSIPHIFVDELTPLQTMKDVTQPTRFGDMIFLPQDAEIIVIGDTHGDLASTRYIIQEIENSQAISQGVNIVFLGDYASNGVRSWQNLLEILTFQRDNPGAVICLNGNHEFKETYLTALNEHFCVHWEDHFNPDNLPAEIHDKRPQHDNHYGHLRFDLIRSFGFVEGERLYGAFDAWGKRLPYICISDQLMMSHSIGKRAGSALQLADLINAKQQDAANIKQIGFANWKAHPDSSHAALVNNRAISNALLNEFEVALGVHEFVVGHTHYRSGDTITFGDKAVTTIASSDPYSPDSGHYMVFEMAVNRNAKRNQESLADGDAKACYLSFTYAANHTRTMKKHPVTSPPSGTMAFS